MSAVQFKVELGDKGEFVLSFPYDPKLVDAVRSLPARRWNKEAKRWTVPAAGAQSLGTLLARIQAPIEYGDGAREKIDEQSLAANEAREASRRTSLDIQLPVPSGLEYLPYQRAGIAYGLDRDGVLIADEMGLGKTIQAIGICNADASAQSILIICPASLRLNWQREWRKWDVHRRTVGIALNGIPRTSVVIVNYDVLKKHIAAIHAREWHVLICDEAHYMKNPKAIRKRLVLGHKKRGEEPVEPIAARRRILLTGTPILNKPVESFTLISALAPKEFTSVWNFRNRYCGQDGRGASNLEELQDRLRGTIMVRRLKADVLKELPPKRRQVIEFEFKGEQVDRERIGWEAQQRRMESLRVAAELAKAGSDDEYRTAVRALREGIRAGFTEISKLRHETALAKVPQVIEHLRDSLESGKVICFGHHKDVIAKICAEFDGCVSITGDTPMHERQAAVDRFQTDASCLLIVGNLQAMGVGLTLTASSHVVFAELDWVPGVISQAEDRAHRIGQQSSVLVQHLVLDDSLDARMAKRLIEKQDIIDRALDSTDRSEVLEEPIIPTETRERAATEDAPRRQIQKEAGELGEQQIEAIHECLRMLARMCDGAVELDGHGFNRLDTQIGHSLAQWPVLTPRQAALGRKLVIKYHRQLPADLLAIARGQS